MNTNTPAKHTSHAHDEHGTFHHVHHDNNAQMQAVVELCQLEGLRLTALRRRVLAELLAADKPLGAYDLLDILSKDGKRVAPPTVYRSLDFLLEHGFVHRLASINAYIPCCHPRQPHQAAFLICQKCQQVQEFSKHLLFAQLTDALQDDGFKIDDSVIELLGICHSCQQVSA